VPLNKTKTAAIWNAVHLQAPGVTEACAYSGLQWLIQGGAIDHEFLDNFCIVFVSFVS